MSVVLVNRWHGWRLGICCLALVASGCVGNGSLFEVSPPIACPRVEVIEQASAYTNFVPRHQGDINALRYSVRFAGHSGGCELDEDGTLTLDQYALFLAQPGIGLLQDIQTQSPWFILVLQDEGEGQRVLAHEIFEQSVVLMKDGEAVPIREHFTITIPKQTRESLGRLQVISGFLLSDAGWEFNEAHPFYFR